MPKHQDAYRDDLAYIHDVGFGGFAAGAAPWLLELFRTRRLSHGLVVDLGCGSGIWPKAMVDAGYQVLGYDISPAMLEIARSRVPSGTFRQGSFLDVEFPTCVAVTAIGEIFNYLFDETSSEARLRGLFRNIYKALAPRGLFVFDVALPGRVPEGKRRGYTEGAGWACLSEAEEDAKHGALTRRITSFRTIGDPPNLFRRDQETHHLRLYRKADLLKSLRAIGFKVRIVSRYGKTTFPPGYAGFIASKR